MMNSRKKFYLIGTALLFISAMTQAADGHKGHEHGSTKSAHVDDVKPRYGGVITIVKDISYELVAKNDQIVLYVFDHGKPIETKYGSASITFLSSTGKSDVILKPAEGNKFEANGVYKIGPDTKAVAKVSLKGLGTQNVRFTLK
jgi:hypothetical protein